MNEIVERFAPSPNGRLHPGHAFSALTAWEASAGGRFLLRIEDIDQGRARTAFEADIFENLAWLGIRWEEPVLRQSTRLSAYAAALDRLQAQGLLYPCTCTRREISEALTAPQEGAGGPDGHPYPGTCRNRPAATDRPHALRLDMRNATALCGELDFIEIGAGPKGETGSQVVDPAYLVEGCGDVVLARKDIATSYHLAVVVDDAFQGVTHVTRGRDLFGATPIHRLLQALLGAPTPTYRHHRLIRDDAGRRLAKRDGDRSLASLREEGATPADIRELVGLPAQG